MSPLKSCLEQTGARPNGLRRNPSIVAARETGPRDEPLTSLAAMASAAVLSHRSKSVVKTGPRGGKIFRRTSSPNSAPAGRGEFGEKNRHPDAALNFAAPLESTLIRFVGEGRLWQRRDGKRTAILRQVVRIGRAGRTKPTSAERDREPNDVKAAPLVARWNVVYRGAERWDEQNRRHGLAGGLDVENASAR